MPGAIILADQPGGAGSGIPGVARNDLWQTIPVVLSSYLGGNLSYQWQLLAVPPGSAATLTTPTASTSGFTPDLVGTYRIQLITNDGGPGNIQTLVFRCRFNDLGVLENRGWAYPAIGELAPEANYGGNTLGWAEPFETILEDIRTHFGTPTSAAGGDLGGFYPDPTVTGIQTVPVSSTTPLTGQVLKFNGSEWAPGVSFTPGGDLTGTSTDQIVSYIQGVPTTPGTSPTVSAGNLAQIQPVPPWADPTDVTFDGTYLWVLDGVTGEGGRVNVFRVDVTARSVLTFPLPSTVHSGSRIITDGTYLYATVRDPTTNNNLVILSVATGAVVGLGHFPGDTYPYGIALDGAGNVWTADQTYGLQGFVPATLISSYPTAIAPSGTYAYGSTYAYDVCSDGTYLYATDGSSGHIYKVNPSPVTAPSIVGSAYSHGSAINALFFDAAIGPDFWATDATNLLRMTSGLTVDATAASGGANTGTLSRMAYDSFTSSGYFYVSTASGPYLEVFYVTPSSVLWNNEAPSVSAFSEAYTGGGVRSVSGEVWFTQVNKFTSGKGLQALAFGGAGSYFIGPDTLTYGALPAQGFIEYTPSSVPFPYPQWAFGSSESALDGDLTAVYNGTSIFAIGPNYFDLFAETTTPTAPSSGFRFFIDSADGNLKVKSAGSVFYQLSALPVPTAGQIDYVPLVSGAGSYELVAGSSLFTPGGDLSGTSTDQTVIALQGESIATTTPSGGQFLGWNGGTSKWTPTTFSGDLTGNASSQTVSKIQGKAVSSTAPSDGQCLMWSAADSQYEPTSLGPKRVLGFGGVFATTQTGPQTATVFPFNPGAFPSPNDRTIVFGVIGQCASASDTLTFTLIDLTDAVTICTLTTSSTVPVELTQALTVGAPGTNVISSSNKLYQVTVQRTGGSSIDAVTIYNAFFEVSY